MSKIDFVLNNFIITIFSANVSSKDQIARLKLALLEIILAEKPKKIELNRAQIFLIEENNKNSCVVSYGKNQGCDEYEKRLTDLFNREA